MKKTILNYASLLMMAIVISFASQAQVANGDFESWTGNTPDGWTTIEDGITLSPETTIIHGGSTSASINVTTATQGNTDFRQYVSVEMGTTYNFSFWAYHTEGHLKAKLFVNGYIEATNPLLTEQWQELTFSYLAEETGDIQVGLRFYDEGDFDGEEIVYIDDFNMEEAIITESTATIISPEEGQTVQSDAVSAAFILQNFDMPTDGHISYHLNGGSVDHMTTDPIQLTGLVDGAQQLIIELVDPSGAPLSPIVTDTVNFTVAIPTSTQVATIAELRAATMGEIYELTGEAMLTFQQSFRNQKYIQDATAAILIDDSNGNITSTYERYDGITGITGTLGEYGGMMQFVPIADPGAASSTGNSVTVQNITTSDLTSNFEEYESELVQLTGIEFSPAATFENGTAYPMFDASGTYNFRTSFYSVDYIGTAAGVFASLVGIPNSRNDGDYFTSRDLNDLGPVGINETNPYNLSVYPNPSNGEFFIQNGDNNLNIDIAIYDIAGKLVKTQATNIASAEKMTIDCSDYEAGMYFLSIRNTDTNIDTNLSIIIE